MKKPNRGVRLANPTTWEKAVRDFMTWLANEERSRFTLDHYSDDLNHFELWWQEANPDEPLMPVNVTEEDLRDWKRCLKEEVIDEKTHARRMPATINAELAAVKSFLGWCHRKKVIQILPEFPPAEKLGTRAVKWLEKEKQHKLLKALARDDDERAYPIGLAILETGLRLSEFVALLRKDLVIMERKGSVEVREGKGRKPRTVPLSKPGRRAFQTLLDSFPEGTPSDPVTTSKRMNRATGRRSALSGRALQDILAPYGVHPHQLRHSFGMNLIKRGIGFPIVAKLMGHTSILTTMTHYGTPSESDLEAAVSDGDDDDE